MELLLDLLWPILLLIPLFGDSQLVVKQIFGEYQVKEEDLLPTRDKALKLMGLIELPFTMLVVQGRTVPELEKGSRFFPVLEDLSSKVGRKLLDLH